jgi:hypothetical protein
MKLEENFNDLTETMSINSLQPGPVKRKLADFRRLALAATPYTPNRS